MYVRVCVCVFFFCCHSKLDIVTAPLLLEPFHGSPPPYRYLRETGYRSHRYALLFGRISAATKGIKVEAMYEPPQASAVDSPGVAEGGSGAHCYDASALTEAAAAAVVAREVGDEDGCGDRVGLSEAAADVLRAVRVAEQLGLRLVGWCLSHDKVGT